MDAFLRHSEWADATRAALPGDASARRYARLTLGKRTAILMDAPPETCGSQAAFVDVARRLQVAGLSAPEVIASDVGQGFVLMEDLGNRTFADLVATDTATEMPLYLAATDALLRMQDTVTTTQLTAYGPDEMARAIRPAWTFYRGEARAPSNDWNALEAELLRVLVDHDVARVVIHRDFHAENLIWLPRREGIARVGFLDFQDTMAGHPLYDLASLLQDARRNVSPNVAGAVIARFAVSKGYDQDWLQAALAVQATQRHLRILGVLSRLASARGRVAYLELLPRVWRDLNANLTHPVMAGIAPLVADLLPQPEAAA